VTAVAVALEYRFGRDGTGRVLAQNHYHHQFWTRYHVAFDEVVVVGRVAPIDGPADGWREVEGPGVRFVALPGYVGPWQYLFRLRALRAVAGEVVAGTSACVLRVPGQVGALLEGAARRAGRPFAVEVVGDPADSLASGAIRSPLAPVFRALAVRRLRAQCRDAVAAAYVTASTLQQRYPPGGYTTHYSDVDLPDEAFAAPRPARSDRRLRAVFIGSLEQPYKGLDVVLESARACEDAGCGFDLEVLGDGVLRPRYERQAADLGLTGSVCFAGRIPSGPPVWERLRAADLYVLASFAEGLPRALIEAMAAGLPCIGTSVGGVPELLAAEDLVPPRDPAALTALLRTVITDPARRDAMAAHNHEAAADFREAVLGERRVNLYRRLRAGTR
jgi:glycosyltransferase involved in cell wall biosynthesis